GPARPAWPRPGAAARLPPAAARGVDPAAPARWPRPGPGARRCRRTACGSRPGPADRTPRAAGRRLPGGSDGSGWPDGWAARIPRARGEAGCVACPRYSHIRLHGGEAGAWLDSGPRPGGVAMAGSGDSTRAIFFALGANLAIAVAKGIAAFVTGSGAMLAETVHSLA